MQDFEATEAGVALEMDAVIGAIAEPGQLTGTPCIKSYVITIYTDGGTFIH